MQKDFSVNGHADKSGHTGRKEGRKCLFKNILNTFYLVRPIWHRTYGKGPLKIAREETRCCHMD